MVYNEISTGRYFLYHIEDCYLTSSSIDWMTKTGGTSVDVSNPTTNADFLTDTYRDYYWYKI